MRKTRERRVSIVICGRGEEGERWGRRFQGQSCLAGWLESLAPQTYIERQLRVAQPYALGDGRVLIG